MSTHPTNLPELHRSLGAQLAPDGIPLHYGDEAAEYHTALEHAILLDRSHEGRVLLQGADAAALVNRMSTNNLLNIGPGKGAATVFTGPTGRILERVLLYRREDGLLAVTLPGRGAAFRQFLQRHILFNDHVTLQDLTPATQMFSLHGPQADAVMDSLHQGLADLPLLHSRDISIAGKPVFAARQKPLAGGHWLLVTQQEAAPAVYQALLAAGPRPAGSLTYNLLRIRAGQPGPPELNGEYIPLEVGLWDEISFSKGCYTGQEIIARMESRAKLSRTIVRLKMQAFVKAPADVYLAGRAAGRLTSSVLAPDGEVFAIGVVKTQAAQPGSELQIGEGRVPAQVAALAGQQPPYFLAALAQ